MFTGIIEEIGTVRAVQPGAKSSRLTIGGKKVLEDTKIGDSICTSGVCLTVTSLTEDCFTADVMAETMRRTKLGSLTPGSPVNLERALRPDTRLGGHIVSGHIDDTGTITNMERDDNAVWVTIQAEPSILRYIIEKGSIAMDGISLTVASVTDQNFRVSVIPHTASHTNLVHKAVGDTVNLENDCVGKYIAKLHKGTGRSSHPRSGVTEEFLLKNGF